MGEECEDRTVPSDPGKIPLHLEPLNLNSQPKASKLHSTLVYFRISHNVR